VAAPAVRSFGGGITSSLQTELVGLNQRLYWATVVIAIATIAGVVAGFLQWAA